MYVKKYREGGSDEKIFKIAIFNSRSIRLAFLHFISQKTQKNFVVEVAEILQIKN